MIPASITAVIKEHARYYPQNINGSVEQRFLIAIRRHLHQHPEIGLQEFETAQLLNETLSHHGLEPQGPIAGTGLFVDIQGTTPGPIVAYRADMDALPIQDTKQVSYASHRVGIAHLCGHDVHTTIALGIALYLNTQRDKIKGTVRVFFQPNEEGSPSGAPLMIQGGILKNVQAAYAIHVDPTLESGKFGVKVGASTAACDGFLAHIQGERTGHSARPHEVVDTIWVANQIMTSLYQQIGRVNDSRNSAILSICKIKAGEAQNVIPASIEFGGTLRAIDNDDRTMLRNLLESTVIQLANLYHADAEIAFNQGAPPVINDATLKLHITETIETLFGKEAIYEIPRPSMGAEDFAHYLNDVPGFLLRVGTKKDENTGYPLHDSNFDVDESVLTATVKLMATILIQHLEKNVLG